MNLSVIIPCFNAAKTIGAQLEALATQRWSEPWEVILSDNGSTDGSRAIAERYRDRLPNLRIVDASDRRGPAHARNVGAHAARGDALAFCDADDEVAPGWVKAIGTALSQYDCVASRFDKAKLNTSWRQKNRGNEQRDGLQKAWYPPHLMHAGGGGLGVRRSLCQAVGGFDESLPAHVDTDFCFKVQLAGVKLHFVPDAVVHVRHRDNLSSGFHQARRWGKYNVLLYKRYRPPNTEASRPWKGYFSNWEQLLRALTHVKQKDDFAEWFWFLGWEIGLLQGSVIFRTLPPALQYTTFYNWKERLKKAKQEIRRLIPPGRTFILVDEEQWGGVKELSRRIPFIERDGYWWGAPQDDATAIEELERLRRSGASFMVFGWPAFWWLDYYSGLHRYLRSKFRCVLENDRLVVFDLRL